MRNLVLICTILLTSCATYRSIPLPVPDEPIYPSLTQQEADFANNVLTEEIRQKLVIRDLLKSVHIRELESILKSTHPKSEVEGD